MTPEQLHDTRGGIYGFEVEMVDGRVLREDQVEGWDAVPNEGIRALRIKNIRYGVVLAEISAADVERVFFMNEGVGYQTITMGGKSGKIGRQGQMHTAKIFGGVRRDGTVVEARMTFDQPGFPEVSQLDYPVEGFKYTPNVFRRAALPAAH